MPDASYNAMAIMMIRTLVRLPRSWILLGCVFTFPLVCWAAKDFVMPKPQPAKSYPAHDDHSTEQVSVGLDPYDSVDKANIFSVHYSELGILPIFVVVTNDGDQPVALTGMNVEMVTPDRTKLLPMSPDDIYRRISRPHAHTTTYPLPFPTKKAGGGVSAKAQEEIQNARFDARAVEPHGTQAGFVFVDVSDMSNPTVGSHVYFTGIHDAKGNEMMYFDVPLGKN
jgi:hypothetical protein